MVESAGPTNDFPSDKPIRSNPTSPAPDGVARTDDPRQQLGGPTKDSPPAGDATGKPSDERRADPDRRTFLRAAGAAVFSLAVIGAVGEPGAVFADDGSCYITGAPNITHDPDDDCGFRMEVDQACGDCDDNHDTDQNCANTVGPIRDRDELCGHQHFNIPFTDTYDDDNRCARLAPGFTDRYMPDEGCGIHRSAYNDSSVDPDGAVGLTMVDGSVHVDQNCASQANDATCGQNPPAYGSSPDENCKRGPYDPDQGCGSGGSGTQGTNNYDIDEACGKAGQGGTPPYDKDEGCGGGASAGGGLVGGWDTDNACQVGPPYDKDENCGAKDWDVDQACNKNPATWDTDNSCKVMNPPMILDTYDTTCNQPRPTGGVEGDGQ